MIKEFLIGETGIVIAEEEEAVAADGNNNRELAAVSSVPDTIAAALDKE